MVAWKVFSPVLGASGMASHFRRISMLFLTMFYPNFSIRLQRKGSLIIILNQLTHLSFADDILVFSDGTARSLAGVMGVMGRFLKISGLHINVAKSSILSSGTNLAPLLNAATRMGISEGSFPIRYLGMPLTTKTLSTTDYEP